MPKLPMPLDEIRGLAGRIAFKIHKKWCGQSIHSIDGVDHIKWFMACQKSDNSAEWVEVGRASLEYLEFVLDQHERNRHESIAIMVDRIGNYIVDNLKEVKK